MRPTITVVGSINVDFVVRCARLPTAGETVAAYALSTSPGGKGANQALAAARLGAGVSLVGAIGQDEHGELALGNLRRESIDLTEVSYASESTGIAIVTVADDGENQITVVPGANMSVLPIGKALVTDAVLCQAEISDDALTAAAAATHGLFCLNAAPARPIPDAVIKRADIIIVNEHEYEMLPAEIPDALVVVTRGSKGAVVFRNGEVLAKASASVVNVVDTVGAGDVFCAAFTVGTLEGLPVQTALDRACAAGGLAVTKPGAQIGMPYLAELEKWMCA